MLSGNRFQEFHEDLSVKNKEMERLAMASADAGQQLPGDADALGARVAVLHNKWRTVWRLSVERKKLLQDVLDHLLEVSQHFHYIALAVRHQREVNSCCFVLLSYKCSLSCRISYLYRVVPTLSVSAFFFVFNSTKIELIGFVFLSSKFFFLLYIYSISQIWLHLSSCI